MLIILVLFIMALELIPITFNITNLIVIHPLCPHISKLIPKIQLFEYSTWLFRQMTWATMISMQCTSCDTAKQKTYIFSNDI